MVIYGLTNSKKAGKINGKKNEGVLQSAGRLFLFLSRGDAEIGRKVYFDFSYNYQPQNSIAVTGCNTYYKAAKNTIDGILIVNLFTADRCFL